MGMNVERFYCKRPNPTPNPLTVRRVCPPPAFGAGGGHTRCVERGWGINCSEDARHCSVLYICKYFVINTNSHLKKCLSLLCAVCLVLKAGSSSWRYFISQHHLYEEKCTVFTYM